MKRTFQTLFALVVAASVAMPAVSLAALTPASTGLSGAAAGTGLNTGCAGTECVVTIIGNAINIVLGFLGVVLLVLCMYAGFKWMTAEKPDDTQKAKDIIKNAVIGMVIIAFSYAFSAFVITNLGSVSSGGGAPQVPPTPPTGTGDDS